LFPQHFTVPLARTAQAWNSLLLMATASLIPLTFTGVEENASWNRSCPVPSCPRVLSPQQDTLPAVCAHEFWAPVDVGLPPALIVLTPVRSLTATGVADWLVLPLPSAPLVLSPQHLTVPAVSSAQVWNCPPTTAAAPLAELIVVANTGVVELVVLPLPSWPFVLSPQQLTAPVVETPQEWARPAEMSTSVARPLTGTGLGVLAPLLPSCPLEFRPQHFAVPSVIAAQVWNAPAAIVVGRGEVRPTTVTGVDDGAVSPFPS
jgi:hypothetical protein